MSLFCILTLLHSLVPAGWAGSSNNVFVRQIQGDHNASLVAEQHSIHGFSLNGRPRKTRMLEPGMPGNLAQDTAVFLAARHLLKNVRPGGSGGGGSTVSSGTQAGGSHTSSTWLDLHEIVGALVYLTFFIMLCAAIPQIVKEHHRFKEHHEDEEGDSFIEYLEYRFIDWFTMTKAAPSIVLIVLTLGVIVTGALLYALIVRESPSHALFRVFVWTTASSADEEKRVVSRMLGIFVTVCGLIILSLLLGIVAEAFAAKMQQIKLGLNKVIEGGHVLVLGYTDCTRKLLEELANARESEGGGVFVLLASRPKSEVEDEIAATGLDLKNSRLIVRSGNSCTMRDLAKCSADAAGQIVILADQSIPREEADAKSVRVLLALKSRNWPAKGHIVTQCCSASNKSLLQSVYLNPAVEMDDLPEATTGDRKVEVVVVGDIVAKLMVQSARQHGLAGVFGMMLGFDGDEFYSETWDALEGKTFLEAKFYFPNAVVLGILKNQIDQSKGETSLKCILNAPYHTEIEKDDKIIVLAEDNDSYECEKEVYFEMPTQRPKPQLTSSFRAKMQKPSSILIIGWNTKIGTLLGSLDKLVCPGSDMLIYSSASKELRKKEIKRLEEHRGAPFHKFSIEQIEIKESAITSHIELKRLNHQSRDSIFVLAEVDEGKQAAADERTCAILAQLQYINKKFPEPDAKTFDPVVEIVEDSTKEHLQCCGLTNLIHSSSLVSQALAAVTEDATVNDLYDDLMNEKTCGFDIQSLEDFLLPGEQLPQEVNFGWVTYKVSMSAQACVVGWSVCPDMDAAESAGMSGLLIEPEWVLNPKDKTANRVWTVNDRVVVIRRSETASAFEARSPAGLSHRGLLQHANTSTNLSVSSMHADSPSRIQSREDV